MISLLPITDLGNLEMGSWYQKELVQKGLPCKAGGCWVIETRIREKGDVPVWIFWREVEPNGIT
jgi:hypothetical protein